MKLKIFCRCSLFPSLSGLGLISTPVQAIQLKTEATEKRNISTFLRIMNVTRITNFLHIRFKNDNLQFSDMNDSERT
jgi:hypothetical protein